MTNTPGSYRIQVNNYPNHITQLADEINEKRELATQNPPANPNVTELKKA